MKYTVSGLGVTFKVLSMYVAAELTILFYRHLTMKVREYTGCFLFSKLKYQQGILKNELYESGVYFIPYCCRCLTIQFSVSIRKAHYIFYILTIKIINI